MFEESDIISRYTRQEAIADGVLVDLSEKFPELVQNCGIKFPVAVTAEVFHLCTGTSENRHTDEWVFEHVRSVLWQFRLKAMKTKKSQLEYAVNFLNGSSFDWTLLKAVIGPGDTLDPVITIMLPGQD